MKFYLKIKSVILAVSLTFSLIIFSGCAEGKSEKYTEYFFDYFDTVSTVIGYAENRDEFDNVVHKVKTTLSEYHCLFDGYVEYDGVTNIKTINDKAHGEENALKVDRRIIELLEFSKEMYALTDGKVNVAMGSVTSVWHEYRVNAQNGKAEIPSDKELKSAAEHCDINDVIISENKVYLNDPELKLDVGAVAKGYAAQKAAEKLEREGISGYVLNLGGNVRAVGKNSDGEKWKVGVEDPDGGETYPAMLTLENESLVTSGTYRRFYTVDGVNYHHIIDPETLYPSNMYKSVSVVCHDSALGDALSTALFNMSIDEGLELVAKLDGVGVLWIKTDGNVEKTAEFEKYTVNS